MGADIGDIVIAGDDVEAGDWVDIDRRFLMQFFDQWERAALYRFIRETTLYIH